MGMANSIAAQIGEVADQLDDRHAAGLPAAETETQHGLDTAVGVDVLAGVSGECRLGDRFEQTRAGEVGQPGPGYCQTQFFLADRVVG